MSLLIPHAADLNVEDHAKIAEAYEEACDRLVDQHGYTPDRLSDVLDPMVGALLALYRAGQRSENTLSRYATAKALEHERLRHLL